MTINIDKPARLAGPVLDIDHLKVTFATDAGDVYAVKDVSLEVNPGEVVAIVGESGSGKTVTAKTILGLLPETATSQGAVLINGNNVISVSEAKLREIRGRDVAMVFQEPSTALNPVFTVGWQIAEGIRAHADTGGAARSRPRKPRRGPSKPSAKWASRTRKHGSTTTRTSSRAARSSASSLPPRWP